jgi:hypothetical protein
MFTYELQQERSADLQSRAAAWRLARDAKAGRDATRKARRTAARTDASADPAAEPPTARHRSPGRVHRVFHPHHAA